MFLSKNYTNVLSVSFYALFLCFSFKAQCHVLKDHVMSVQEFKDAINNDDFLKAEKLTTLDKPLSELEIELIELALKNQNKSYGGIFEKGREIHKFQGSTLLVGGGKTAGNWGENDGKTILFNFQNEKKEISELIDKLNSGEWDFDPYTGRKFHSDNEKYIYTSKLKEKIKLYEKAFKEKNNDILKRYYILNIEYKIKPDIIASINNRDDMNKIPNKKFSQVEFENVPCDVFLNPALYPILERITKTNGSITFSMSHICRRLIVPVIRNTKFNKQFIRALKEKMYNNSGEMDSDYGSCEITVKNM
ncbi:MAG: hypothetical protein Q8S21_05350 [Candidatus Paracaedibacteraceae bacterium]|nr:hypothetical protein [Candidatus Paracaedibacteraceae bacterium]